MTDIGVIDELSRRTADVTTDALAVQVSGLRMSFGATEVLRGVDFDPAALCREVPVLDGGERLTA